MSAPPRVAIVGAGLAGSLLAWRIAQLRPECRITLFGRPGANDATAASGGLVRGFEPDPAASAAAAQSLAELRASPTLRTWSGYHETGSVYLCPSADGVAELAAAVADQVGGPVRLASPEELRREYGFAELAEGTVAVVERRAGYISPNRLRDSVLADVSRLGVEHVGSHVSTVEPNGGITCRVNGESRRFDVVVLATGRWTGEVLVRDGLPADGYRTKLVQYGIVPASGPPLPSFIDDTSGLYGRSAPEGQALLGLPSDAWDVAPDGAVPDPELGRRVAEVAAIRLPRYRFGQPRLVASIDCYTDPPGLALRAVPGCPGLFTFTGGSGGAAKTTLAASRTAAELAVSSNTVTHMGGMR